MSGQFTFVWLLLRRLALMIVVYTFYRLLFLLFNYQFFTENSSGEIIRSFIVGIRFDVVAIIYVNSVFILLHLLPFHFRYRSGYQLLLKWIYFITNFIALFFALVDLEWFGFVRKR